jgi:hypothetical protein
MGQQPKEAKTRQPKRSSTLVAVSFDATIDEPQARRIGRWC